MDNENSYGNHFENMWVNTWPDKLIYFCQCLASLDRLPTTFNFVNDGSWTRNGCHVVHTMTLTVVNIYVFNRLNSLYYDILDILEKRKDLHSGLFLKVFSKCKLSFIVLVDGTIAKTKNASLSYLQKFLIMTNYKLTSKFTMYCMEYAIVNANYGTKKWHGKSIMFIGDGFNFVLLLVRPRTFCVRYVFWMHR